MRSSIILVSERMFVGFCVGVRRLMIIAATKSDLPLCGASVDLDSFSA